MFTIRFYDQGGAMISKTKIEALSHELAIETVFMPQGTYTMTSEKDGELHEWSFYRRYLGTFRN